MFQPLIDNLTHHDVFQVVADSEDYSRAQNAVDAAWRDPDHWSRSSIANTMGCGFFSSDRAIADYARQIWKLEPIRVGG